MTEEKKSSHHASKRDCRIPRTLHPVWVWGEVDEVGRRIFHKCKKRQAGGKLANRGERKTGSTLKKLKNKPVKRTISVGQKREHKKKTEGDSTF